jgi:hypothetical protein
LRQFADNRTKILSDTIKIFSERTEENADSIFKDFFLKPTNTNFVATKREFLAKKE